MSSQSSEGQGRGQGQAQGQDQDQDQGTTRVLYVLGKGRSGSTLIDHLLGEMPAFESTGELWWLWRWGYQSGYRCGCGEPVPTCTRWAEISRRLHRGERTVDRVATVHHELLSWYRVPQLLATRSTATLPALDRLVEVYAELYASIAELSGARVVVDSSKFPAHPGALGLVPGVEPVVVHLVRDPRAVTFSYRRHKLWRDRGGEEPMPRFGPVYSATSWMARNLTVEALRETRDVPVLMVRYEDFVAHPRETLLHICALAGEPDADPPVDESGVARLSSNHMVGGNPDRGARGEVRLERDDEWQGAIGLGDAAVTTALTLPLLPRYGYPAWAGPVGRRAG